MSFSSVLSHIGSDLVSFFKKAVGVEEKVAADFTMAAPFLASFAPVFTGIVSTALTTISHIEGLAEAAVAGNTGSTAQKTAAVVSAISPSVISSLQSVGINANTTHVTAIVNGLVATLNAIPAPATETPATVTPTPAS